MVWFQQATPGSESLRRRGGLLRCGAARFVCSPCKLTEALCSSGYAMPRLHPRPRFTSLPALFFPAHAVFRRRSSTFLSPQTLMFGLPPTPIVVDAGKPAFFLPLIFLGHCFGPIPASCSFAASAFPVPPSTSLGSLP
jgi:hypothetical protein